MKSWQRKILIISWLTYASFYLVRVNMSVAMPGIMDEFDISKTSIGWVLTALFFAYAAGQFINGQLGDKFKAKRIVTIGLLTSAILNILFGFVGNFLILMIIIWGLNGYFQSMGWAPIVKTVACWFPAGKRGRASGILGTSYIVGSALSWLLAGFIAGQLGWRWVFWIPGIITIISALHWTSRIKNSCEEVGFEPVEKVEDNESSLVKRYAGIKDSIITIVKDKRVWLAGFSLFGLNIVRYGFLVWAPTYFFEVQKASISLAAYKALIFPLAGAAGALCTGWFFDKLPKKKQAYIAVFMLLLLATAALLFSQVPLDKWILSLVILGVIGFLTFGPHMMIVTALPMSLGSKERASSVAGFIDGWGYVGAALTGVGTGFLIDNFGWSYGFYFWISGAIIAAILIAILQKYNQEGKKQEQNYA